MVLAASLAGPAAPALRALGARIVPGNDVPALTTWLPSRERSKAVCSAEKESVKARSPAKKRSVCTLFVLMLTTLRLTSR